MNIQVAFLQIFAGANDVQLTVYFKIFRNLKQFFRNFFFNH